MEPLYEFDHDKKKGKKKIWSIGCYLSSNIMLWYVQIPTLKHNNYFLLTENPINTYCT